MLDLRIFLCSLKELYNGKYVAQSDLLAIKEKAPEILHDKKKLRKMLGELFFKDFKKYREMRGILREINFYLEKREKINQKFIANEQKKPYEIEGNRLDPQQIAAVVACEDAELILASAGSGKSASLLAKVNYVVKDLEVPAEEVLVIAFTRKVVEELKERVKGSGVEICTFHSFGNKIIKENHTSSELKLVPEDLLEKNVEKTLRAWRRENFLKEKDVKEFGDLESLEKLLISTLQLQKNEQISLAEFKGRIEKMRDGNERAKAQKFFKYYQKVYVVYEKYLREHSLYDFSDMLSQATKIINEMEGKLKYQYVLVDEVQDLSKSKSLLLRAILNKCEKVKLFAVGDDWQSIYRFAGSNLGVLNDFEKTFNRTTYRGVIRRTYRFGQPTAWVSEYFIRKNPHQSKKKVQTFKKTKTPIVVRLNPKNIDKKTPADYASVDAELQKLYKELGEEIFEKRVQVISRYNRDLYRLVDANAKKFRHASIKEEREDGVVIEWSITGAERKLEVAFCSMHKSKGITRDIVLVINMNEAVKGMPSTRADDPILATMLAKPDPYPLAEERRLFYVAITRATEKTIVICDKNKISPFVREIAKNLGGEIAEMVG